ncbi:hypothetical protein LPICM17_650016 [Lactococcus piscium]|nr:hypothetical protein LPICM17_650016 [Lactococcus piscium]
MVDWQNNRIASALAHENPTVMVEMSSGFTCFGDTQLFTRLLCPTS